jgi:uncharacterized protein
MSKLLLLHWSLLLSLFSLLGGCSSAASPTKPVMKSSPVQIQPTYPGAQNLPIAAQIVVQKKTINLEVASTRQEQAIGLMFRRSMPSDRGMLFNFSQSQPAQFWMKNTFIPLDMLFLHKGVIKNIQINVPPCKEEPCPSYGPQPDVLIDQVIELNAGRVTTLGLKVGDKLVVQKVRPAQKPLR